MYTRIHNAFCNETIFVTVRLNAAAFASLQDYMKSYKQADSHTIYFPYGVELIKHGYGWYKLVANSDIRGVEKIHGAMKIIKRWRVEETEKVEEQIKAIMPAILTNTRVVAFSNAHSEGELLYAGAPQTVKRHTTPQAPTPQPLVMEAAKKPADPNKLALLAKVFSNKHSTRHSRG